VVAVTLLEVACRLLLLRIRGGQRRVDVDHCPFRSRLIACLLRAALWAYPELPGPRPREGDSRAQPVKALPIDRVDHPKRRRVRRHPTEQVALVALSPQISETVPAIGEHHRQVAQHHSRVVRGAPLARGRHRLTERPYQPDPIRGSGHQRAAGMPHLARAVRAHM